MKRVAILGSTGSIGRQALDVIAGHPDVFCVAALAANARIDALAEQANRFEPAILSAGTPERAGELRSKLTYRPKAIESGADGLRRVAAESDARIVLAATDGTVALRAVLAALESGIDVALANKELAVAAGALLFAAGKKTGANLLPVDSEHSAVFQCLAGEERGNVRGIVLTASGGPFWDLTLEQMRAVTPEQALRHPTWSMGAKNTLDSATLMNKGLEVIEASRFFGLRSEQIEVVVHRQSVAHAFVFFSDGNVKAQLASPDMRLPIGYALAYPERLPPANDCGRSSKDDRYTETEARTRAAIGLAGKATLAFEPVDHARFPALRLAYRALTAEGTAPAVLSAANEEAGRAFLQGKIRFTDIGSLVERALDALPASPINTTSLMAADASAREYVRRHLGEFSLT